MADETALLPIDLSDRVNALIGQAQSALASSDAGTMQRAGQAIVAFLSTYRSGMEADAADWQGELDQLDAAQSQLNAQWQALGGVPGSPGQNNMASPADAGSSPGYSPSDSFFNSIEDTTKNGLTKTLVALGVASDKATAAIQANWDTIKIILYILAAGVALAAIAFAYAYAGGTV